MTDFRALCAELLSALESWSPDGGGPLEGQEAEKETRLIDRARAALAEPEPEGPTRAELRDVFEDRSGYINDEQVMWWTDFHTAARAVLARWGTPNLAETRRSLGDAPQPVPMLPEGTPVIEPTEHTLLVPVAQPVPVSERLPGDELCWWYEPDEDDDPTGYGGNWTLLRIRGSVSFYTHWLPAHALPVPADD